MIAEPQPPVKSSKQNGDAAAQVGVSLQPPNIQEEGGKQPEPVEEGGKQPEPIKESVDNTTVHPTTNDTVQQSVKTVLPSVSPPEPPTSPENKPEPLIDDNTLDEVVERTAESGGDNEWHAMLSDLNLGGMAKQLAEHCLLKERVDDKIVLTLDNSGVTLQTSRTEEALVESLSQYLDRDVRLEFEVSDSIGETPEKRRIRLEKERQLEAEQSIEQDLFVKELREKWGGVVLPGSVRPNLNMDTF